HQKVFTASVRLGDRVLGCGVGRTKKAAEQAAAFEACEAIGAYIEPESSGDEVADAVVRAVSEGGASAPSAGSDHV
ncbi:MAG: putative dsRNA-binding protein, partial [Actinomycetes bacterium]